MKLTPKQNTLADEWLTLCSQSYIRYGTKDYDDLVRGYEIQPGIKGRTKICNQYPNRRRSFSSIGTVR